MTEKDLVFWFLRKFSLWNCGSNNCFKLQFVLFHTRTTSRY